MQLLFFVWLICHSFLHGELATGVNHHQTVEQTSSSGPIWNKSSITTEKHKVHVNPNFGGAVHIHSPDVVVERVSGSGLLPGLYSGCVA